jgi:hypothetical protein
MCGGQSGMMVHVVNGVVERIEPNNWNPNNYSIISTDFSKGYTEEYGCAEGGTLCPKGNAGIVQLLRSRSGEEAAQAHESGHGGRRGSDVAGDLVGPGSGRDRGQDEGYYRPS